MNSMTIRAVSAGLLVLSVAACAGAPPAPPPPAATGAPSTDVNPITGSRGGSGAGASR